MQTLTITVTFKIGKCIENEYAVGKLHVNLCYKLSRKLL